MQAHKHAAMPAARHDIAASLQLRRTPILPVTPRQSASRVLQTRHTPQQLSLFEGQLRPTRPVDPEPGSPTA